MLENLSNGRHDLYIARNNLSMKRTNLRVESAALFVALLRSAWGRYCHIDFIMIKKKKKTLSDFHKASYRLSILYRVFLLSADFTISSLLRVAASACSLSR